MGQAIKKRNNVQILGSGRHTLIFAHGFVSEQSAWRHQVAEFQKRYRIVLFDHVGCGGSDFNAFSPHRSRGVHAYADVASFPAVLQDLDVVAPEHVSAAEIEAAVRAGGGELLESTRVFDVYTGGQLEAGSRSLTLRLEFRAPDRTLTDQEVAASRSAIESAVAQVGGRLRG